MNQHDPPTQNQVREELWRKYQRNTRIMDEAGIVMCSVRLPEDSQCVMTRDGFAHCYDGQWHSFRIGAKRVPVEGIEWWTRKPLDLEQL